jgi:hypothetical protein
MKNSLEVDTGSEERNDCSEGGNGTLVRMVCNERTYYSSK